MQKIGISSMTVNLKYSELVKLYSSNFLTNIYLKIKFRPGNLISEVEEYVPEKGMILDVGCGIGYFDNYLFLTSNERKIYGIDYDEKRINLAKKSLTEQSEKNIKFELKNVLDFKEEKFDCIIIYDVIHHLNFMQLSSLIKKISNCLKNEGILLIKDIEPDNKFKIIFSYFIDYTNMMIGFARKGPLNFRNKKLIKNLVLKSGFTKIDYKVFNKSIISEHILYIIRK